MVCHRPRSLRLQREMVARVSPMEREQVEAAAVAFVLVLALCGFVVLTVWVFYR